MAIGGHCFNLPRAAPRKIAFIVDPDGFVTRDAGGEHASRDRTWLVFRVGPYVLCASALAVEGIIQRPLLVKAPFSPEHVLGAFLFRGRGAAAFSLRKKLKLKQGSDGAADPLIVARIAEILIAFSVDEVRDVIEEKDAEWRPVPATLEGGLVERFGVRGRELILQTSFAALRDAEVEFAPLAEWSDGIAEARAPAAAELPEKPVAEKAALAQTGLPVAIAGEPQSPIVSPTPVAHRPRIVRETERQRRPARAMRTPPVERPRSSTRVDDSVATDPFPKSQPAAEPRSAAREQRSPKWWFAIAAATFVGAFAAILYGVLPRNPADRQPATISHVTATKFSQGIVSRPTVMEAVSETRVDASRARESIVVTIEHGADKAKSADSRQRVHVVVSGETLWQITKEHVGDPFRYPELAKLSNLSNPDLIHPGDIVRFEIRRGDATPRH